MIKVLVCNYLKIVLHLIFKKYQNNLIFKNNSNNRYNNINKINYINKINNINKINYSNKIYNNNNINKYNQKYNSNIINRKTVLLVILKLIKRDKILIYKIKLKE